MNSIFVASVTRREASSISIETSSRIIAGFHNSVLLHHPHLRPVIGKVLAAIEADDVKSRFALRNALPFTVAGVLPARRDRRERLRDVAMPAAYRKQLEHFVPHRGTPSFESWGGQRLPPAHNVRLSTAPHSQAEDYLSATKRVRFRNRLTVVPFRNPYTRTDTPVPGSGVDVAPVSLDSPLAFWPGLRMSIPPLK